jgi:hypothetical protein
MSQAQADEITERAFEIFGILVESRTMENWKQLAEAAFEAAEAFTEVAEKYQLAEK